ncbi:MAG: hypothetical protein AMJ54_04600 [Deltaproteobacteria bacterium SG8_13]|nr:MAG: hypothetical protein AMJ54_04600 [Deltaproteobacteria bacterium SG8_13]
MKTYSDSSECSLHSDDPLRILLEGTATATGEKFFEALVESMVRALDTKYAWVTEYLPDLRRLRALAFWVDGELIPDFEIDIDGTPCEEVIDKAQLVHYPDNIRELFPRSAKLKELGAVGYMGVPLMGLNGTIIGHLAVIDDRPMPEEPKRITLFRIFAARAAAELHRIRAESRVKAQEEKLSHLVASVMDAMIEIDENFEIVLANPAAETLLDFRLSETDDKDFSRFLTFESRRKLSDLMRDLAERPAGQQYLWVPAGLGIIDSNGTRIATEATLSQFEMQRRSFYTLILRNINERLEVERKLQALREEAAYLREKVNVLGNFKKIVGQSRPLLKVLRSVEQVAATDTSVLLFGETGTGKELIARAIHATSLRKNRPFIAVNCAAIPETLMESEFFGHEKGAFTGATHRKEGFLSVANGGTIFLDEVGELSKNLQAKLLRVLQDGEFTPVGSAQARRSDARVIAATNCDLAVAVQEQRFRTDLYYRLNVFPIDVPPLRQRSDDIRLLAEHFVRQYSVRMGRRIEPLNRDCVEVLKKYDWPGNVRELQNVIERGVITARDGRLNLDSFLSEPMKYATEELPKSQNSVRTVQQLRQLERNNLLMALEKSNWRVAGKNGAAMLTGMPPSTFQSRMKALGVRRYH